MGNDLQATPTRLIRKWFLHCQGEFFLFPISFPTSFSPSIHPLLVATSFLIENFRFLVRPSGCLFGHSWSTELWMKQTTIGKKLKKKQTTIQKKLKKKQTTIQKKLEKKHSKIRSTGLDTFSFPGKPK
jgi:hypothetical protein